MTSAEAAASTASRVVIGLAIGKAAVQYDGVGERLDFQTLLIGIRRSSVENSIQIFVLNPIRNRSVTCPKPRRQSCSATTEPVPETPMTTAVSRRNSSVMPLIKARGRIRVINPLLYQYFRLSPTTFTKLTF
jgi:hypothetical protein